jgi:hypothetical protein
MADKEQGLSLRDISDFGEKVDIGDGRKLQVKGISAQGVLLLLMRFPDLQKWLSGQSLALTDTFLQAPETIAAVIAAGTGAPGDTDAEDIAASLPMEVQTDVLEAVYRQTFRNGFGPFVKRVLTLYAAAVQSGNFGGDPGMKSPPESKPLSPTDTPQAPSGTTPPDK